ncbi:hypothetical protein [Edaphobacter sp. HDX4]|uniref:hypothetical protein n=1 Tax=Edaphobacter sp. HDX4 TaxID=2794064 RepID=UPI002FE5124F
MHDFQILLILRRGAAGDLVEPLAYVAMSQGRKPGECCEKMVVAADTRAWYEAAHREIINHLVVERRIFESISGITIPFSANYLCWKIVHRRRWFEEAPARGTVAKMVVNRISDEAFGIYRAREVHVQIGPLWHLPQKGL